MGIWNRWIETISGFLRWHTSIKSIFGTMQSVYLARAYYLAAEFQLADRLQHQPKTAEELAAEAGVQTAALARVLRLLAACDVLREDRQGKFHLCPRGRALLSDQPGSLREWLLLIGRPEVWQGFAMARRSLETGKCGFELAHGKSFYNRLIDDPELHGVFIRCMSSWTDWQARLIVQSYDFDRFGTVVDVGGGHGSLVLQIVATCPHVRTVLFDQPETIAATRARLAASPHADRCQAVGGNFLESVPPGGDAYLVKHVLRDWDDEHAAIILDNCRRAMRPGARLLLIEAMMDPRSGRDRLVKLLDFEGSMLLGGRLRTREELNRLLSSTGFHLAKVHRTGLVDSLILESHLATMALVA